MAQGTGNLIPKTQADSLSIQATWNYRGPQKNCRVKILVGHKDIWGHFGVDYHAPEFDMTLPVSQEFVSYNFPSPIIVRMADAYPAGEHVDDGAVKIQWVTDFGTPDYTLFNAFTLARAGNGNGIDVPTVAEIMAATTLKKLEALRPLFEQAYQQGQISYSEYMVLYNAYAIRYYELV